MWPLVRGPQVFAFNHFLGICPGPLYDEALRVTPASLLWFRLETLLLAWRSVRCSRSLPGLRDGR